MQQVQDFHLAPNFPTSQSHWASVGCAGRTSPIHGSLTFQLQQRLAARYHSKPSERCHGVHASTDQSHFGG